MWCGERKASSVDELRVPMVGEGRTGEKGGGVGSCVNRKVAASTSYTPVDE